ncbi:hypothetical protein DsansV1_C02g0021741 [Dioscorea sansibarensis]
MSLDIYIYIRAKERGPPLLLRVCSPFSLSQFLHRFLRLLSRQPGLFPHLSQFLIVKPQRSWTHRFKNFKVRCSSEVIGSEGLHILGLTA